MAQLREPDEPTSNKSRDIMGMYEYIDMYVPGYVCMYVCHVMYV